MFRRFVSLLVIAGFLASQLVGFPHAHASLSAAKRQAHDATPHVHSNWFSHTEHKHCHDHQPSSHRHDHEANSVPDDSRGTSISCGRAGLDHDFDAVFVLGSSPTLSRSNLGDDVTSAWHLAVLAQVPQCLFDLPTNSMDSPRWHPPDEVLDGSGIYLTLRNLRI